MWKLFFIRLPKEFDEIDDAAARRRKKKTYYAKLKKQEEEREKELAEKYRDRVNCQSFSWLFFKVNTIVNTCLHLFWMPHISIFKQVYSFVKYYLILSEFDVMIYKIIAKQWWETGNHISDG